MKIKDEIKRDLEKAILSNEIDIKYLEKIQTKELIEHKMSVADRDKIKNSIILCKMRIDGSKIKLGILKEL